MRRTFTPNPPGIGSPCGLRYMLGSALRSAPLGGRRPWGSKDWYVFSAVVVMSLLPPVPKGRHKAIAYIWGKERGVFQGRTGLVSTSFAPQSSTDLSLYVPPCQEAALTRRVAWRRSGRGVGLGPSGKQLHPATPELTAWRERPADSSQ